MSVYKVIWEVELDASSDVDAALRAQEMHRDATSTATVFQVVDERGRTVELDLAEPEGHRIRRIW